MAYCEIPHKGGGPKAPTAIPGTLVPALYPNEKASVIGDYLENLFTPHELFETDHEWRVEARVQALLISADGKSSVKFRPCDVSKEIRSIKLGKACGIDGIPNKYLRNLPRRPLVHKTHLFIHCLQLCHFPAPWKEAEIIALPKCPQNLRLSRLLSTTGKPFDNVILRLLHRHIQERNLLNASQFGFRTCHSTTLQCMKLTNQVSLNSNNNMLKAAVFLDIIKAFHTTWHPRLLYKLSEPQFSASFVKLRASFLLAENLNFQ
jgi:hypothetical protein